ncbi:MAG TPA: hypothetical protein VF359_08315 [Anaerolineales bacterium]
MRTTAQAALAVAVIREKNNANILDVVTAADFMYAHPQALINAANSTLRTELTQKAAGQVSSA